MKFKEYTGLEKTFEYSKEKATLLAEAMTEAVELNKRLKYLETLCSENENLKPFLWRTLDGRVIALHDLEDNHLKNIMTHVLKRGDDISAEVQAKARSRSFMIPETPALLGEGNAFDINDDDDFAYGSY